MRLSAAGGVLVLTGASLLAGCAEPPPPAPVAQSAAPAPGATAPPAPGNPDGVYNGTSTRYLAQRRDCPHPGLVEVYVQDRQFTYRWAWGVDVPAVVAPDGSVTGQDGDIQLSGHVDGSEMTGNLTNGACALHFTLHRRFRGA